MLNDEFWPRLNEVNGTALFGKKQVRAPFRIAVFKRDRYLRRLAAPLATDISDAELVRRFSVERDTDSFSALVGRYGPLVLAACRRVLADNHAAEDCFQATFLVLARKAASL